MFILQCLIVKKNTANCLKRAATNIVLSVLDVPAYIVSFSASLDMNQVPEKLSFGQYLKQYVMKEAVIYKILRYRQNRIDVTPMRSDGEITADTKQKSNNFTSPTVSVRIHRIITRQHPRLHQNPHHKNSTPNISTRCKRNSYITSIPIDFVLPKLLNYLAFQSFDFELPDEGYSRNVHVH